MLLTTNEQHVGTAVSALALGALWLYGAVRVLLPYGEGLVLGSAFAASLVSTGSLIAFSRRLRREAKAEAVTELNVEIQRAVLGLFMISYGLPKLFGGFFDYQLSALDAKMGAASEFELAWYFYGKNPWQELFSGVMELVPGCLLLHRRTHYVAAAVLLPVTSLVFTLNWFFKIGGLTLPFATVLLLCNLSILYSQRPRLLQLLAAIDEALTSPSPLDGSRLLLVGRWVVPAIAVALIASGLGKQVFRSEASVRYEALVGAYTLERMQRNDVPVEPDSHSPEYRDLYIERQSRWNLLQRFDGRREAFLLDLSDDSATFGLVINKGGTGDSPDVRDEETALRGTYMLEGDALTLTGTRRGDRLVLRYLRREPRPRQWFW